MQQSLMGAEERLGFVPHYETVMVAEVERKKCDKQMPFIDRVMG
jgi:hypothetical protein